MSTFTITTDAGFAKVEAESIEAAIMASEGVTLEEFESRIEQAVSDGGWARIENDGEIVLEIGSSR